ncbi:hypothetical protein BZG35_03360 [Brevundimonas sp. LM2]|uniref:hypothetical protein n=1 Tax=Brevundimonas sp. LM2 TaxID=1938605 RepID=UPI000983CC4A|nr:hypothetical protein [Brevundimonas sp. LM2]AQR60797.1 hypothetical protein BZG35_03360 [Brevundimonas sp. LM2]
MLRMILPFCVLIAVAGCAPAPAPTPGQAAMPTDSRRCFAGDSAFVISRAGTAPVYLRVRTGQTLEVAADDACVQGGPDTEIRVRALGPEGGSLCVGDRVTLEVASASVIARTCRATITRMVPEDAVAGLPNRVRP